MPHSFAVCISRTAEVLAKLQTSARHYQQLGIIISRAIHGICAVHRSFVSVHSLHNVSSLQCFAVLRLFIYSAEFAHYVKYMRISAHYVLNYDASHPLCFYFQ